MSSVIALTGPSGVGKNAIMAELIKKVPDVIYVPSFTTRVSRPNEIHGLNYYFVTDEEFLAKIARGEFLEKNKHYGSRYGIDKVLFEDAIEKGRIPIKDIDVEGALKLKALFGDDCLSVYIAPPSYEELQRRLGSRAGSNQEDIKSRLERFDYEQSLMHLFDLQVVNDKLDSTVKEILDQVYSIRR
jgi:guanylate kinase